ncbi:O-methylsterigmatocystin oxidoreductase OS=Aspergillus parasiticus GN=ordA PE=3 SV=1 [Rhizoctonia solani AG-1 IB]|uniref:O-methylsterigmatocystin oxidoreductase n=1 Tax=Thanatephorus cucumeris (strain AG1-IB / isolate 7/3/14) TaxID=1108050 RepID=A0A0B7F9Y5_THACB|nr:O-methylsterigmatocystin oxidoreductase OS=Aspergillus parasiticus GN=ordA PE=3 SV=1 [Rhizoctonia solani AG-1 IB]
MVSTISATLAGTWIVAHVYRRHRRLELPLPPGPPEKSWFGGNALDMPRTHPWIKFTEWAKTYGDVMHLRVHTNHVVVLSSYQAVLDLFESRGALYSHRPRREMAFLMGWERIMPFRGYDEDLKLYRRYANQGFNKNAAVKYHAGQTRDVHVFLQRLVTNSGNFVQEFNMLLAKIIMRVTYGYSVADTNDPHVTSSEEALESLGRVAMIGGYFVDSYPFLRHFPTWLPGMGFKAQAREWSKLPFKMANVPFEWTKQQMATGSAVPSFLSELLENNEDGRHGEEIIKWTAASMYGGGSHTTVGILNNFILAMLLYPEVAHKAREEIDRVIGTDRLPNVSDRQDLPYLECVLLETLRWYPVTPLSIPRRVSQDDQYRGYHIPANSTVYNNVYAITRDESVFPDPESFIPERFDDKQACKPLSPRDIMFGIGRRVCPGQSIADTSIFLVMANILATMDIKKACDESGNEIEPEVMRGPALVCQLRPFKCSISPRSEHAISLIDSAVMFSQ